MPITKTQMLVWVVTLIVTARLVYAAVQHNMAVLDTAAIALLAAYGFKAALENVAASVRRARSGVER
jgi:hypothetical protein